jgi:hypothetical protein
MGRLEDAHRELLEAQAIATRTLGPEHELVALTLLNLGATARREGRPAEALAHLEASRAIYAKQNHPQGPRVELERGTALLDLGRAREAEQVLSALANGFAQRPQDRSEVRYRALAALGLARARQGLTSEGAALARGGLAELERNGLGESDDYAYSAGYLAEILERQGAADEAREWRERSHALLVKLLGADHPMLRAKEAR